MTFHTLFVSILANESFLCLAGEHPRMGALDVCPFIPVQDVTMEECVQCANQFAAGLAATLNVPGEYRI